MGESSFLTFGEKETIEMGRILGQEISLKKRAKDSQALVLALNGDLGGGKTAFLKGFAKGLGIKKRIVSPTFVIFRRYPLKNNFNFYHFDCYRLESEREVIKLGFGDIVSNPKNIVAIEWAQNIKKSLPKNIIEAQFSFVGKNKRKIKIKFFNSFNSAKLNQWKKRN